MGFSKAALGRLAAEVRQELGLSDAVPFDPHLWAREYGVPFVSIDEVAASPEAVEYFIRDRPDRWSAALLKNGSGHIVVYNSAHSVVRVRSNLAHEVAHLVAEHVLTSSWIDGDGCAGVGRSQETEAAELAGALLVPANAAKVHAMRGSPASSLAARFEVSIEMATWRMRASGGAKIAERAQMRRRR